MPQKLTQSQQRTKEHYGRPVLVMSHRGIPAHFPENTMLSFSKALELDIDIIEFDVRTSTDGKLVIIHDETVDRTTNGHGRVSELSFPELRSLDAGAWKGASFAGEKIPTLAETYERCMPFTHLTLNVEIKSAGNDTAMRSIELAAAMNIIDRCVFTSFDAELLAYMKSLDKRVRTQGFPRHCMKNFSGSSYAAMDFVGIPAGCATHELFSWYAGHNIEHGVWCIDDAAQAITMAERGACIITSNDPKVVIDALAAGGYR